MSCPVPLSYQPALVTAAKRLALRPDGDGRIVAALLATAEQVERYMHETIDENMRLRWMLIGEGVDPETGGPWPPPEGAE